MRHLLVWLLLACGLAPAHAVIVSAPLGTFVPAPAMAQALYNHTATLLPTGQVLITTVNGAQLFDPRAGVFLPTGAMAAQQDVATATLLPSGKVLIAGTSFPPPYASAELYDPVLNQFGVTGNMITARYGASAASLPDGRVLIVGGRPPGASSTPLPSAELYDPSTGTFHATGMPLWPRFEATMTVLQNGDVLLAGGTDGLGHVFASAEIYRVATGTFAATASMGFYRVYHAATLLPDGTVLVSGGWGVTTGATVGNGTGVVLSSAELFHPSSGNFSTLTAVMTTTRENHTSTLQHDGKLLLCGGEDDYAGAVPYADIYDPVTQRFTRVIAHLITPRTAHHATLLADGRSLITGGEVWNAAGAQLIPTAAAELFAPDALFAASFEP
ncbi:hypothetical protein ELE36_02580 [Pseudolysobacter antarcticus]|uniref:Kelch-like protein n=1 Tax=Pseudolysobacter antarcticus TaxID=2511995 RepID=A0A411HFT1_9GAMM|nr:kelch repeat-containing protein [Pseudolysobacter antarcticus]QBB69348.1 hypothetical protein ELE36_02580 [Pseudolysobacter antarcticus]